MYDGAILIGGREERTTSVFHAAHAATGAQGDVAFSCAGPAHVGAACAIAEAASPSFSALAPKKRAEFLEVIAAHLEADKEALVTAALAESGLPRARLEGEVGRTAGQLRLFAEVVGRGDWLDATIDPAMPDRKPLPRADLRRMNMALGPVAVFGASNFPLAFSVAGGDTASALAAGCPVVVKGHPAHPATGEIAARAIMAAVSACGLHPGVFSYLPGPDYALGEALVADARIKAVGFTGSRGGGLALVRIAAARPEPIPVYAEMSSINPVVLLPAALAASAETLASGFVQSLTLGAGQFCTNPGLVIALAGGDLDRFVAAAAAALGQAPAATMLTAAILEHYQAGVGDLAAQAGVERAARGADQAGRCTAALFVADAGQFMTNPALAKEVFGPSSLVLRCLDMSELAALLGHLEGQLTTTLHTAPGDEAAAGQLLPLLTRKAGRVLANGWPTGVEVTHAMVHGGPVPATSDGRSTSVGSLAIARFLRPVCYQDIPGALLPPPLQDGNPWRLNRRINGVLDIAAS